MRLPRSNVKHAAWAAVMASCCAGSAQQLAAQQPPPPRLALALPLGIQREIETELTFAGQRLASGGKLWSSVAWEATPSIAAISETAATTRLTLPASFPLGIFAVRVYNDLGVSNLRLMLVDDLATREAGPTHNSPRSALPLTLPSAVEGACASEQACYFKFQVEANQLANFEVYARRLASPLDPVLRVLSASGEELAYRDDEPGLMGDCRLSFHAPSSGEYLLELRDVRHAGGPEYRFRLRAGDFPLANVAYPLAVQRGGRAEVTACVTEGPAPPPALVEIPADYAERTWPLAIEQRDDARGGSAFLRVLASELAQMLEQEPNDSREQATELSLPVGVNGRFARAGDRDWRVFSTSAAEFLSIDVYSRRLGSPACVALKLVNSDGDVLAETNPADKDDGSLRVALPAAGRYYLLAEELYGRGGDEYAYNLELNTRTPGFELAIDRDHLSPPQQGVCSWKVFALRSHYRGAIELALRNGPPGATLSENTLAAEQHETTLKLRLPSGVLAGELFAMEIIGKPHGAAELLEVVAQCADSQQRELRWSAVAPLEVSQRLALGVGPAFPPFLKLSVEPSACLLPRLVGAASWQIKAERLHNFSDAILLQPRGLPPGVTATGTTIEKGTNETTLALAGGADLIEGEHPISFTAEVTLQGQPQTVAADGVLKIIPPLQVALAPAGALPREGKQKLTITVTRFGQESHPVKIELLNLPEGVAAVGELLVPPGVNTLVVELQADLTASPGKFGNLLAKATTRFQAQDIAATSPAVELEVVESEVTDGK